MHHCLGKARGDAWTERNRRERTDEWATIQQWMLWPEQELYEQIRPLVLFHQTAGERAKEIDVPKSGAADGESFWGIPGAMNVSNNDLDVRTFFRTRR